MFHRWARVLAAAVVALAVAAPAARAGHQDLGTRCALYFSGHRGRAACLRHKLNQSNLAASSLAVAGGRGFHWSDAGVGAVGAFSLVALAGGLMVATRHRTPTRRAKA